MAAVGVGAFVLSNGTDESSTPAPDEVPTSIQEAPNELTIEVAVDGSENTEPLREPVQKGAATTESFDEESIIQILPLGNKDVLELTADDVVQVMRATGFSDKQIYEHGTAVRDGMAESGAVQIKIDGAIKAVFTVEGDSVYINSSKGPLVYNVKTGWQK